MGKKKGKLGKLLAFTAGAAAAGTLCYVYKDKIKEFVEDMHLDSVTSKVKSFVTDKVPNKCSDDEFFDEDEFDEEAEAPASSQNRGYVSLSINPSDSEEKFSPTDSLDLDSDLDATSSTKKEESNLYTASSSGAEEMQEMKFAESTSYSEPSAYEYEGLSDVSEDPDTLAEEDALDGPAAD